MTNIGWCWQNYDFEAIILRNLYLTDLHVVRLAPASDLSADVVWSGSGDEVVVLAGLELQASG